MNNGGHIFGRQGAMRIIIIYDTAFTQGGAAKVAIAEAAALAEQGYDVTYFSSVGPVDERLAKSGAEVICLDQNALKSQLGSLRGKVHGAVQGLWNRRAMERFQSLLDSCDPSGTIVHFHGWTLALSPALFSVTAKRHFKVAVTCHDYELNCPVRTYFNHKKINMCKYKGMSLACLLTNCDSRSYAQKIYRVIRSTLSLRLLKKNDLAFLYPARSVKDDMDKNLCLSHRDFILDNPVEIRQLPKSEPQNNDRYLYIGRVDREKGLDLFCSAVTKANVPADVIGDGEEKERLMKLYPNITFHGWLTSGDMEPIIRKARCLIVTSLWAEIGPLVVPEVQCTYGLPCIVPTLCGRTDDIREAKTGLIYEIGDEASLLQCVQACKNDEQIAELAANCRKMDIDKYSEKTHVDRLREIYEEILSGRRAV